MKNLVKFAAFLFSVFVFSVLTDAARGAVVSWQGLGGGPSDSGSWEAAGPSGWSNGATPGLADVAQLLDVTSGTRTITVDAPETIGGLVLEQDTAGPLSILTLNNNLTINSVSANPITTTTAGAANPPVINVGSNTLTVATNYQGLGTMTFGNVNIGTGGTVIVQNAATLGGNPPGNSFNSTFGSVSMASGASIQFSSMDLWPTVTQTFAGPLSVTGTASISESSTRWAGGSIAFDGGVSVTGVSSSLNVTANGPVTFGTPTTPGLSLAAGDSATVSFPGGSLQATVTGLSLPAGPTLLTFTGQDAGTASAPITVAGTVSLGTGSTVKLAYTGAQSSAVFNIANSGTVTQDGATLDFDYNSSGGWNNGARRFVNNGNWTLQNNAMVMMTQLGNSASVPGAFGNLSGNVNSGTMSVNSGSQVAFVDMTNSGTLNLGTTAAIGGIAPNWTSTLTNAGGGIVNVTGTGALFMGGAGGSGNGGCSYVGQPGSQLNVPAGTSLTFSYQSNASLSNSGTINQNGGTIVMDWNNTNYYNVNSGFSNAGAWTLQNGAALQFTRNGALFYGGFGVGANNSNVSGGTLSVLSGSSLMIGNLANAGTLVLGTSATVSPNTQYPSLTIDTSSGGALNVTGSGVNLFAYDAPVQVINEQGATTSFSSSTSLTLNFSTGAANSAVFSNSGTVNQAAGSALVFNWNDTSYNNVNSGFTNAGTWTLQNGAVIESTRNGALLYGAFGAGASNTNASGGTLSVLSGSSLLIGNLANAGTLVLGTNATMGSSSSAVQGQQLTIDNKPGGALNVTGSGVNLFAVGAQVQVINELGATTSFSNGSSLTMNFSTQQGAVFNNAGTVNQAGGALVFNWNDTSYNNQSSNGFANSGTWSLTGASLVDFTRLGSSYIGGFNIGNGCTNAGMMNISDSSVVNFNTLTNTGTINAGNAASAVGLGTTATGPTLTNGANGVLNVQGNTTLGSNTRNGTVTLNNGTGGSAGGQVNVGDATHVATFDMIGGNAVLINGANNSVTVAAGSRLGILSYEDGNPNPYTGRSAWLSNAGTVTLAGAVEFRPNHTAASIGLINSGTGATIISGPSAAVVRSVPAAGSMYFGDNANNAYNTLLSLGATGTVLQGASANDVLTYINNTGGALVNALQVTSMGGALAPGNGSGGSFLSSVGALTLTNANLHLGSGTIASITVNNGGSGYTTAPGVTFASATNGYGWGAAATAVVSGGSVTAVNVTGAGQFFATSPAITFGGPGNSASATANITPVPNSGGTVTMDIGGMYADTSAFDQLNVGGLAGTGNFIVVNGSGATLNINAVNGFTPTGTYKLITANNVVGAFDNVEYNGGSAAGIYTLSYTPTGVSAVFSATAPTWTAAGGNNWSTGNNWTGGNSPNAVDAQAVVGAGGSGSPLILDVPQTIGHLVFDNATTNYTISGTNALTFQVNSSTVAATITTANGTHTLAVPVTLASNLRVDTVANSGLVISGNISGNGYGITKTGSGTLTLSNSGNSYSGATTVNAGTLLATVAQALPASSNVYVGTNSTAATLDVTAARQTVNSLTIGSMGALNEAVGNPLTISGAANFSAGSTINVSGNIITPELLMTYAVGQLSGSLSNVFNNGNPLPGNDSLSYSGGSVEVVSAAGPFTGFGTWVSVSGATWDNNINWEDGNGQGGVPGDGSRPGNTDTATFSGSGTVAGTITLDINPNLAALSFSTSNYTLSGGNLTLQSSTGTASVTVTSGSQAIQSAVQIAGGNLAIALSNSGVLAISGNIADDLGQRSLTLAGDGSGRLILSGTNSYGGGTNVNAGTMYVTNSSALPPATNLTVGAGGTFIFDPNGPAANVATSSASPAGLAAVPEPGTLSLLAVAMVVMIGVWRRRSPQR